MISRDILQNMFDDMRARAKWDIDGLCLWGYFFTDHNRERLEQAVPHLERMGYRFVDVFGSEDEDEDERLLFLHVERREVHTVDSLVERNQELYQFAEEHGLETYDGMDVGPLPKNAIEQP